MTHLDLADRFIAAVMEGDMAAMLATCEPGAFVWHNTDEIEQPMDGVVETLSRLRSWVPDVSWTTMDLTESATGFVWQALVAGTARGGPFRVRTCFVATVGHAGTIRCAHEYIDTARLAVLQR